MSGSQSEMVLFTSEDGAIKVGVRLEGETAWLTQAVMAELFGVKENTITYHLQEIYESEELLRTATTRKIRVVRKEGSRQVSREIDFYNLDAIIAVGYRVNSKRATQFRIWATSVLKQYILKGYALNDSRLKALGRVVQVLKRAKTLDAAQVLSVVERYTAALDLLDDYDHQRIGKPKGRAARTELTYAECRKFIDGMKFGADSSLFGNEKDDSFKGSLGAVYQTFGGKDVYPAAEEKAAQLLYFVVKNHSFSDGNKRIGAAIFLYFLERNGLLLTASGEKRIADDTLVALTVMIAESKPAEHDIMVNLVMTFLAEGKREEPVK